MSIERNQILPSDYVPMPKLPTPVEPPLDITPFVIPEDQSLLEWIETIWYIILALIGANT